MSRPATYANPVLPGFFPDPSVVRVGADYYLVNSTFQYFPAIILSHSRDLVHWRQIGHVFRWSDDLVLDDFYDGCGIWAPDISHHDGTFYVFFCLVQLKKDRSVNVRGNFMVKSASPHGPWTRPVQLTTEGNDPSHFVDDDGAHYLLYAGGIPRGGATRIVRLNDECTATVGEAQWIDYGLEVKAPEGPHLIKRQGVYYHTMAAGSGLYDGHHQLIARSDNVFGPYELSPHNPFIAQHDRSAELQHHGHAKLVQTQRGEWWTLYLCQRRVNGVSPLGRETGLDRVDWLPDGWPVLNGGAGPSAVNEVPLLDPDPVAETERDEFDAPELGVRWQWVRNPDPDRFSLTERPGWLRLFTGGGDLRVPTVRGLLLQRETSHRARATTRLEFEPRGAEEAGLACYYDTRHHVTLGLTGDAPGHVRLVTCVHGTLTEVARLPRPGAGALWLRVSVSGLRREFEVSADGVAWVTVGVLDDASFLSDEGTTEWGFTGTMSGVFAVDHGSGARIAADFDWFHYKV